MESIFLPGGKIQKYSFESDSQGRARLKILQQTLGSFGYDVTVLIREGSTMRTFVSFKGGDRNKSFFLKTRSLKKRTTSHPIKGTRMSESSTAFYRKDGTLRKRQSFLRYGNELIQDGHKLSYDENGKLINKEFYRLGTPCKARAVSVDKGFFLVGQKGKEVSIVRAPSDGQFSLENIPFRDLSILKELVHNSATLEKLEESLESRGLMAYKRIAKTLDKVIRKEMYNA